MFIRWRGAHLSSAAWLRAAVSVHGSLQTPGVHAKVVKETRRMSSSVITLQLLHSRDLESCETHARTVTPGRDTSAYAALCPGYHAGIGPLSTAGAHGTDARPAAAQAPGQLQHTRRARVFTCIESARHFTSSCLSIVPVPELAVTMTCSRRGSRANVQPRLRATLGSVFESPDRPSTTSDKGPAPLATQDAEEAAVAMLVSGEISSLLAALLALKAPIESAMAVEGSLHVGVAGENDEVGPWLQCESRSMAAGRAVPEQHRLSADRTELGPVSLHGKVRREREWACDPDRQLSETCRQLFTMCSCAYAWVGYTNSTRWTPQAAYLLAMACIL